MAEYEFDIGQKVQFIRIKPGEAGQPDELLNLDGTIVGMFADPNRRLNYSVRETNSKTAFSVEPYAINPTENEKIEYFNHRQRLNDLIKNHNDQVNKLAVAGNAEVDRLNVELFGEPILEADPSVH